jgi:hypothetical protein
MPAVLLIWFGRWKTISGYLFCMALSRRIHTRSKNHCGSWPNSRHLAKRKCLVIDSVNAIDLNEVHAAIATPFRLTMRQLVEAIEEAGFLGFLIAEQQSESDYNALPYLVDTVIHLGTDEQRIGRTLEVVKSRSQNFHRGRHAIRISGRRGIVVYPSLSAFRSTLRRQVRATLSEFRSIELPSRLVPLRQVQESREKSSTLITGPNGSGKTLVRHRPCSLPALNSPSLAEWQA